MKYWGFGCLGSIIAMIAGWLTHIINCLMMGKWCFLIAGAIFFPIGIIHGFLVWFGLA